jgi:hypothetical protein
MPKLKDILEKGDAAIAAISLLLGQKLTTLDCSDVESITNEKLEALFSQIPTHWEFVELAEVIDPTTISNSFGEQLTQWLQQRLGIKSSTPSETSKPLTPKPHLDIFNLRDEVIQDYRSYIESFLRIRDTRVKEFVGQELDSGQLWTDPL